jgi:hypothetical protein
MEPSSGNLWSLSKDFSPELLKLERRWILIFEWARPKIPGGYRKQPFSLTFLASSDDNKVGKMTQDLGLTTTRVKFLQAISEPM